MATDRGSKKPLKYSRSDPSYSSITPSSGQPSGIFAPSTRGVPFASGGSSSVTFSGASDLSPGHVFPSTPSATAVSSPGFHPVTPAEASSDMRYQKTNKNIKLLTHGLRENVDLTYELRAEMGSLKDDNQEIMAMLRRGFGTFENRPDFDTPLQAPEKNG